MPSATEREASGAGEQDQVWPTVRGGSRRLFVITLIVAVIAHLPAMPFDPLFLARILLHTSSVTPPETEEEVLIPIDLDLLADAPRTEDAPPQAQIAETPPAETPGNSADAPPPKGEPSAKEAPSKPPVVAAPKAEDIYDELDKPKRGTPTLKDPLAIAGGPGKFGPKNAFVQVLFNGNRLRGNTAGSALGGVLTSLPDWKSFFDGTNIDPITDTEHLLIAGPQFRRSRDVVVWMQYRVSEKEMREAIDKLVKKSGKRGKWIADAPVPAAYAVAHLHRRIFALIPGKKLLVILPASSKEKLATVKAVRPFNNTSKAGIVIALTTPRNAFSGFEDVFDVPKTFKWMRLVVTPMPDGGADVALEIGDSSAENAAKNAPNIQKQLSQVRTLASIATLIGAEVLPDMKVEVDNDILRVKATVSRKGLSHILNFAKTHFSKKTDDDKKSGDDDDDENPSKNGNPAKTETPATNASSAPSAPSSTPSASSGTPNSAPAPKKSGKSKVRIHFPNMPK